MILRRSLFVTAVVAVIMMPARSWAHGDATTTEPGEGDRVSAAPSEISIHFSEPPTNDSRFTVLDGCGADVLSEVAGGGADKRLVVSGGSPGKWKVTYNVISATDGHHTQDRFTFSVAGKRDCGDPRPGNGSPDISGATPPITPAEPSNPSSFPIGPVIVGVGIVALAVAVRVLSSR